MNVATIMLRVCASLHSRLGHVTHIMGMNEALINARHALINDMYMNVRSFMSEKHSMNEHAHSGVTIQP